MIDFSDVAELQKEAAIFGRYLLHGDAPDGKSVGLYVNAHMVKNLKASGKEEKLLGFSVRNRWVLGAIDGGLAFKNPDHIIRRKLLLMSAILEARPQYAALFIPQKRSMLYIIAFAWIGFRAICKAMIGRLIITIVS